MYETIGEELHTCADETASVLRMDGLRLSTEKAVLELDRPPIFVGKGGGRTVIVEVDSEVRPARVRELVLYARTATTDTRVWLVLPADSDVANRDRVAMDSMGVGLYIFDGATLHVSASAVDQSMVHEAPDVNELPQRLRAEVKTAFRLRDQGNWKESFKSLSAIFEDECREYLYRALDRGRVRVLKTDGSIDARALSRVRKIPIGPLIEMFESLDSPNLVDTKIPEMLSSINPARITIVHNKRDGLTESQLRRQVPRHMLTLFAGLKMIP